MCRTVSWPCESCEDLECAIHSQVADNVSRLSYVTEQVAAHTNGTIGALLNATFGNAPELLISTAALRAGFYRVVQLAMLGSMLTNLLFVFGLSCLVGGAHWQVQELRITSGNVSVGMLLAATAGSVLPAALILSGQMGHTEEELALDGSIPSKEELTFSRINAAIMMMLYIAYLIFQLGTHKEEFDEEENVVETEQHLLVLSPHYVMRHHGRKRPAQRNRFCLKYFFSRQADIPYEVASVGVEMARITNGEVVVNGGAGDHSSLSDDSKDAEDPVIPSFSIHEGASVSGTTSLHSRSSSRRRRRARSSPSAQKSVSLIDTGGLIGTSLKAVPLESFEDDKDGLLRDKSHEANNARSGLLGEPSNDGRWFRHTQVVHAVDYFSDTVLCLALAAQMSFRIGIVWLLIITLCISAMSDILVDTIDGFAYRLKISEVFTSMVIVPFFSNVAEQVSAVLFAYRNKMDLCVGVTVGSAIQIALFVLPGSVLIGWMADRSMTLYFRGYETCCLVLGVIIVAAVLQGGTTNWLVGMTLIGIYIMMASGFWFHELEDLSTDAEIAIQNSTTRAL